MLNIRISQGSVATRLSWLLHRSFPWESRNERTFEIGLNLQKKYDHQPDVLIFQTECIKRRTYGHLLFASLKLNRKHCDGSATIAYVYKSDER